MLQVCDTCVKYVIVIKKKGPQHQTTTDIQLYVNENHDIAIAMSSSRADHVMGQNILLGWLGVFKYLNQCHCTGLGYLNIKITVTALAGGI